MTDESALTTDLADAVSDALPAAIDLRHRLHAQPRLSGDESDTLGQLVEALPSSLGVEYAAQTGAFVHASGEGPYVGLRAELDALPIREATGLAWRASGSAMHACGHDVHMAALVAVLTAAERCQTPMPMLGVFQPREEGYPSGARDMVASGALQRYRVSAMVGAHVQPMVEVGTVACTPGIVNAAADEFEIEVTGTGGHAAYPHTTHDPVLAASSIVVSLQQLTSRNTDPMLPAVLTIGEISAGSAANLVPGGATLRGTLRSVNAQQRAMLIRRMRMVAESVAHAHECTAAVRVEPGEPPLANDLDLTSHATRHLKGLGRTVDDTLRSCGSDDFAYYGEAVPSLMMFVGVGSPDGASPRLHSENFAPSDDAVHDVAFALLAGYLAAVDRQLYGPEGV